MSNEPHISAPPGQRLYGAPLEGAVAREPERPTGQPGGPMDQPGGPMGQLFPVMAVLLAQVLDLDQTTKESSP